MGHIINIKPIKVHCLPNSGDLKISLCRKKPFVNTGSSALTNLGLSFRCFMVFLSWCIKFLGRTNSWKYIILNFKDRMISKQGKTQKIIFWNTTSKQVMRYSEVFLLYSANVYQMIIYIIHLIQLKFDTAEIKLSQLKTKHAFLTYFIYLLVSALRYQHETITLEERSFSLTFSVSRYCSTFAIRMYFSKLLGREEE